MARETEAAAAPLETTEDDDLLEVTVFASSPAEQVRRSAYVVTVVETEQEKREGADLGEVLARNSPVTVQRASGLGSRTAIALGGLGGERLRFFIDAVPIELMGFLAGPGNVPVDLIERIDVYQGAVPIRLAGDALGGAVNLVTDDSLDQAGFTASYQYGSFQTHRLTASGRAVHRPSGFFARVDGFYDLTDNDYDVDVTAYDEVGRITDITVPRFHGGYRGRGGTVGIGLAERSWADRLVLQGFYTDFHNDVQNGTTMARPYGEVTFDRYTAGTNLSYSVGRGGPTQLDAIAGFAHLDALFLDTSTCIYDWYGTCTPRSIEGVSGEINGTPSDQRLTSDTVFLRTTLQQRLHPSHRLRFAVATTHATRLGRDQTRSPENDALSQPRRLTTVVAGAELESSLLGDRVANVASLKGYYLQTASQALLPTGEWKDLSTSIPKLGGGNTLRIRVAPTLFLKGSYEYAVRQPSLDELYGDGQLVLENLELRPESSHNLNAAIRVEPTATPIGALRGGVQGFARYSRDLITQLASNEFQQNVNVWNARALGLEASTGWTSPGDWVSLEGRVTYQDVRNVSAEGDLASRAGDRLPNTPFLFGAASARFQAADVVRGGDAFEVALRGRYVHDFFLGWESLAQSADRLTIPAQLTFGAALVYAIRGERRTVSTSFGVDNLTDAATFDFYRLQRPGRTFFAKWTVH